MNPNPEPDPPHADPPTEAPRPADQGVVEAAKTSGLEVVKKSVATRLVELAQQQFELGVTPEGEAFAIPRYGPPLVRMVRGGRGSLRAELARGYFQRCGSAPSQGALADALQVLTGMATECEPTLLALRVARSGEALVLDLGDATGQAVVIRPEDWKVDQPPVLFRRTELTAALPTPQRGGELGELWRLINVTDEDRPVLAAVLVSALMPTIPHVITALVGEQGSGKTSATRMLAGLVDPSPAQVRRAPRDVETWTTAAAGSWVVALDNLSGITDPLSDALCRACTGDGDVRRRLYSDGDLHVIAFKRVVFLNGIDLGTLNDDLADRLVTITLTRLADDQRRQDTDITHAWRVAHPRILGALLDLTCAVLRELPTIHLGSPPRMADFGYVLTAVDTVLGTHGMGTYLRSRTALAEEAMTSDPVLSAIAETITTEFLGTSAELLTVITPLDELGRGAKDWPTARELTTILRRRAPSLRRLGWMVEEVAKDPRARATRFQLIPPGEERWPGNVARNARTLAPEAITPGQKPCGGASEVRATAPTCERGASDDARSPDATRIVARTPALPLSSANSARCERASVASDISGPSLLAKSAPPQLDGAQP